MMKRWLVVSGLSAQVALSTLVGVHAQGTAFTYQGYLRQGGAPVNANHDFQFSLWTAPSGGSQVGSTLSRTNVPVQNGLFTVGLDFGAVWDGSDRYLEITVRPAGSGSHTTLSPRVKINPTPYAVRALSTPWSGITGIPAGFADGIDNDTTYSAGAGLALTGTTFSIAPSGVVTGMIADLAITTGKLADNAVTSAKIADGTIGTADLANGAVTSPKLSATGVSAGTYGSATQVGVFTVDAQGRITSASNTTIAGVSPGGAAGGDLSGSYPNPTVARLQGRSMSNAAPSSGQVLKWDGSQWAPSADLRDAFWQASGVEIFYNAGSVGIGTTDPEVKLHVVGGTETTPTGGGFLQLGASTSINISIDSNELMARNNGAVSALFLNRDGGNVIINDANATGNVGIGTNNPTAALDVNGATNENILRLGSSGSTRVIVSQDGRIGIGVGSGLPSAQLIVDGAFGVDPFRVRTEDSGGVATTRLIVTADGNVGIGTITPDQKLVVNGTAKVDVLQIVGADLAEKFPTTETLEPGTVVEIDPNNPGHLRKARGAYNKRVAGVVAGANGLANGIVLGNLEGSERHTSVAISGRVWVYTDASKQAIEPGDFLTTSDTPGYAMKATDLHRAQGAILGKAMTRLEKGSTGFVLVLVNLQ